MRKHSNKQTKNYIVGPLTNTVAENTFQKLMTKKSVCQDLFDTLIYTFSSKCVNVRYPVFLFSYVIVVLKLWLKMEIFHADQLLFLLYILADKNPARLLNLLSPVYPLCFMGSVTWLPVLSLNPNSVYVVMPH